MKKQKRAEKQLNLKWICELVSGEFILIRNWEGGSWKIAKVCQWGQIETEKRKLCQKGKTKAKR